MGRMSKAGPDRELVAKWLQLHLAAGVGSMGSAVESGMWVCEVV